MEICYIKENGQGRRTVALSEINISKIKDIIGKDNSIYEEEELQEVIRFHMDEFLKEALSEDDIKSYLNNFIASQRKTKKRWVAKEKGKGSFLDKKLKEAADVWIGEDGVNRFQKQYGYQDFHQMRMERINELEDWAKDDNSLCSHFKFFKQKQKWQRDAALRMDIKILCLRTLLTEVADDQKLIVSQLNDWSLIPVDYSGRGNFPEASAEEGENVSVVNFNLPGGTHIQAELNTGEIRNNLYSSPLVYKLMNSWDLGILRFVLFKLAEKQYRDTEVVTTRQEMLEFLKFPNNGRSYELIEASIKKLISLTVFVNMPNKRFSLRFLEDYVLDFLSGTEKLTISLNKEVYAQALNGKTTAMYKDVIDSLSGAATAIVYRLQILRLQHHYNQESPIIRVDLDFFKSIITFKGNRKNRIQATIESALDEMVKLGVTVKRYLRVSDNIYEIEFLELSYQEQKDLGTSHLEEEQFVFALPKE